MKNTPPPPPRTRLPPKCTHNHLTRTQTAAQESALESLLLTSQSRYPDPDVQAPISYMRAKDIGEGPMGKVVAGVRLMALRGDRGCDRKGCVLMLALAEAVERVERERGWEGEMRMLERERGAGGAGEGEGEGKIGGECVLRAEEQKDSMCSKVPFVAWLAEECARVDEGSLRVLLAYVGAIVGEMEGVLNEREREAQRRGMAGGNRRREGGWREPRVVG